MDYIAGWLCRVTHRREIASGQRIEFSGKAIPANANPPFIEPATVGRKFIVDWGAPLPVACGETKESVFEPNLSPLLRTLKTSGAWAVDSGQNLFVSMPVLGDDPAIETGGSINFITDGNLEAIIPPGPDGARYYPGAVVR